MFAIMYLCSVFASISQLKIVPILGPITTMLDISYAQISWMMSVFTIAGIVLAIPAGGLVGKFGPKKVFLAIMIVMILGNIVGAIGINNYPVLLFSRILEGSGFAMCSVAGIVFVNMWFPDKNTGLFVGLFVTFAALASVVALNVGIPITTALGITSVWWLTAGISAALTALFALIVKEAVPQGGPGAGPAPKAMLMPVLKNGRILTLCVSQLAIGFILYFFLNNYPSIFSGYYGLEQTTANLYGSLNGLWGIPGCILGGFVLDRLGEKGTPKLVVVCYLILILTCFITTLLNPGLFIVHTVITAVFPGLVLTAGNFLIPRCVDSPVQIGYGIGTLALFYNIGIFIGNPIIMYAVQGTGNWSWASYILTAASVVGLIAIVAYRTFSKSGASAKTGPKQA
jgi:predicted MFS family arabinose efflux permease